MEAVCTYENSVYFNETKRRNIPEFYIVFKHEVNYIPFNNRIKYVSLYEI